MDEDTITAVIRQRTSCRSYEKTPMPPEVRAQLADFCATQTRGPLGAETRFLLISATEEDRAALKGLGTYGFIRNPTAFILGAVKQDRYNLEDFGYLLETIVLRATALGLGTCWLGGSFTRSSFARAMALREGELLPAVIAAGLPAESPRFVDRFIRSGAGSDRRLPWEQLFFNHDFATPLSAAEAGVYTEALELVRLGPSASNRQPWRVVKTAGAWHYFLQHNSNYRKQMKLVTAIDLQRVDIGIAMSHFALTANALGLQGSWQAQPFPTPPDPNTEYVISWVEGSQPNSTKVINASPQN